MKFELGFSASRKNQAKSDDLIQIRRQPRRVPPEDSENKHLFSLVRNNRR